jgi:hypothetical protein
MEKNFKHKMSLGFYIFNLFFDPGLRGSLFTIRAKEVPLFPPSPGRGTGWWHRDKTRVQMPAKIFPHLKVKCYLFMGPTLGFDTEQRKSFLIKFGVFYN